MSVKAFISALSSKPVRVQRQVSAVVGAIVADAASQHLQWVYDQESLATTIGSSDPEFWAVNMCPYFSVPNGKQSCYGDEVVTCLKALAATDDSKYNADKLYATMQETFAAPDSPYQIALAKRPEKKYPIEGPWLNGGLIKCFENVAAGVKPPGSPDNHDADGFCLALPLVAQEAEIDFDASPAKSVTQMLTTHDVTLAYNQVQAAIIQGFINGEDDPIASAKVKFSDKSSEVVASIVAVEDAWRTPNAKTAELVKQFGLSCSLPGSFQSSLVSLLSPTLESYAGSVRSNMSVGGDCCSRSIFIGACLGAKFGLDSIPAEWLEKVNNIEEILKQAERVVSN